MQGSHKKKQWCVKKYERKEKEEVKKKEGKKS